MGFEPVFRPTFHSPQGTGNHHPNICTSTHDGGFSALFGTTYASQVICCFKGLTEQAVSQALPICLAHQSLRCVLAGRCAAISGTSYRTLFP